MEQLSTREALEAAISNLRMSAKFAQDDEEIMQFENIIATLQMILDQEGCEHFDPAVKDGRLTHLMDVIIFG